MVGGAAALRERREKRTIGIEEVAVADRKPGSIAGDDRFSKADPAFREIMEGSVILRDSLQIGRVGRQRMSQDGHAAAADEAVVPAVVVVKLEGEDFGAAAGIEAAKGLPLDLGLDAAAAERARLRAVGVDEHRGAGLLRRAAARLHDRTVDARHSPGESGIQLRE
jgi:hypothetical protein